MIRRILQLIIFAKLSFGSSIICAEELRQERTSASEYLVLIKGNDQNALKIISSFGWGIQAANSYLEIKNKPTFFCPSADLVLSSTLYVEIFKRYIEVNPEVGEFPAEIVMLYAIVKAMPCQ